MVKVSDRARFQSPVYRGGCCDRIEAEAAATQARIRFNPLFIGADAVTEPPEGGKGDQNGGPPRPRFNPLFIGADAVTTDAEICREAAELVSIPCLSGRML